MSYRSDENDFPRDFLIPVLGESVLYRRSVGFFSTTALVNLTVGLYRLADNGGHVEVVCSPRLSEEDIEAISAGYRTREEVINNSLLVNLSEPVSYFEEERLNLVATMIASGLMDIHIAFMETDTGINVYHEKMAIFVDNEGNRICYNGSLNESETAFFDNFESIDIFRSWEEPLRTDRINENFERLVGNNTNKLTVIPFPEAALEKLLSYKRDTLDRGVDDSQFDANRYLRKKSDFNIPSEVALRDYQKEAVKNWIDQGYQGIFSMCTGSGKSYTALACMVELAHTVKDQLAAFIVCPYIHLVSQWEEDVVNWGIKPIIAHSKSPDKDWKKKLKDAYIFFRKKGKPFICITTNDTFCSEEIQQYIERFNEDQHVFLAIDEAHNFGSARRLKLLPENIRYRAALSATIKRHMDKKGTQALFDYFKSECITYDLEQAIKDGTLVRYKYYPIPVYLERDELEKYEEYTKKLKKFIVEENGKLKISEEGKLIVFARSRILAAARQKIPLLKEKIIPYRDKKNILVYCGAATMEAEESADEIRQIDLVTEMLQNELGISTHRFTAEENLIDRENIKKYFTMGLYQVITAIRCLDEGVNIPGIETAFILSSSQNPKEFIQRRGRLLRRSPGKEYAVIYDFVTLPRKLEDVTYGDFDKDRTILLGELSRIHEFGRLADNQVDAMGMENRIMEAYDTYIDIDEAVAELEEYYGD